MKGEPDSPSCAEPEQPPRRNVEIKARVGDRAALERRVAALADHGPVPLQQEDTFFCSPSGRLKLRMLDSGRSELIFYRRPDIAGPKESMFMVARLAEPAAIRALLEHALGVVGVVRKRRLLYLIGRTRVHLDEVEGLGSFVELEVVLSDDQPVTEGQEIAADLMSRLGIGEEDLVEGAYLDLSSCSA